jgi:hypothetical protein
MVRWAPLTRHLQDDGRDRIKLTYAEIEAIVGGPLPESAKVHRPQFWSNAVDGGMSRHWMRAGYRTALRGIPSDVILFVRGAARRAAASTASIVLPVPAERRTSTVRRSVKWCNTLRCDSVSLYVLFLAFHCAA